MSTTRGTTNVENAISKEFKLPCAAMQRGNDGGGVARQNSQGRWQCASPSPVLLEMAHCQKINGDDKLVIIPQQIETPLESVELGQSPQPAPISTDCAEVLVNNDKLSVYGVLRAAKQEDNQVTIVVEPGPSDRTNIDLHCKNVWFFSCLMIALLSHRPIQVLHLA